MQESQRSNIACKVKIRDWRNGRYVREEGWQPNYIIIGDGRQVSRVNLIGIVVLKPVEESNNYQSIIIDDGSGKISVRSFEGDILKIPKVGDVILLIGRPREYGNEKYIVPEIVRIIDDKKWIDVRKLEIELHSKKYRTRGDAVLEEEIIGDKKENNADRIFKLIKDIDNGDGVDTEEIISKANVMGAEKIIANLLEEGEIFEIKPGKLKVLE